ncbi:poly(ethylene terephthalate) hydrolase family protein [Spirillospora sp. NBC_01491]|uniref:poly(ethylene terephthalate) hydrolase family protein n=1 Tax=Spirillospora sp. NBC_01491 TaxID=2976007 RepID=UPI002E34A86C|nr:acetylxylan esterase [Spirillospora sp. NBC_01491]
MPRSPARRLLLAFATFLSAVALALPATAPPASAGTGFPPVDGAWSSPGPYAVAVKVEAVTTFYYPRDIGQSALRHPVIIWGNGSFAFPVVYRDLLIHWASHGFVVAASNSTQADTGLSMRAGIDRLARLDGDAGSPFHGRIDLAHVGASGHSQGAAGAINAAADPRVDAIAPIQPGPLATTSGLHGPALFLAGQRDSIVWPALVRAFYDSAGRVPAVYAELKGADHFTTVGDGGGFRGVTTAWFRFHLMGDEQARGEFFGPSCAVCTGSAWSDVRRNAEALQIPAS